MDISLTGRSALVTGGNTGIGRAVSLALAEAGANVVLTYYSHETAGRETERFIRAMGRQADCLRLDATDSLQADQTIAQAADSLGGHIDILVNNVGHLIARVAIAEMSDEHWDKVLGVNLDSAFYCTRAVLPYMTSGWGRIVNISSLAAQNGGGNGAAAYAAAKAGLIGFTRGLAKELAPRGITVNAVAPGLILGTAFHDTFSSPDGIKDTITHIPLGRGGTPEDVAGAVLYLASDLASFVTGEVTEINGGAWFT